MGELAIHREERDGVITFHLAGEFNGSTAFQVRDAVQGCCHKAVVLDFAHVRDFYDFGIAVLAHGLLSRDSKSPQVSLRGLRQHQHRMFRYFGIDPDAQPPGLEPQPGHPLL